MCSKIQDKINESFREHLGAPSIDDKGVPSIDDKIKETRLGLFRNVQRRLAIAPARKSFSLQVDALLKGRGGPKRTWMED